MSSPMRPPPGGPPPGGPPPGASPNPLEATQSPLNPGDAALMAKSGQTNPEGTFGEFMESSFGIKWEDPLPQAMEKMKAAAGNASPQGKMSSMASMPQAANTTPGINKPMPQGRPMAAQGGLESLMGR